MSKEYNIGIYIRLSMADEDTGYGSKAESDSIGNQRMLINRFLDNHPELSHCQRSEFADDGYTGTNFHRPQFTDVYKRQEIFRTDSLYAARAENPRGLERVASKCLGRGDPASSKRGYTDEYTDC